jgi:hypothetical protein
LTRHRKNHHPSAPAHRPADAIGICPDCGKRRYRSKRAAREFARVTFPGARMRTYECGDFWHVTSQDAEEAEFWRDRTYGPDLNRLRRRRLRLC